MRGQFIKIQEPSVCLCTLTAHLLSSLISPVSSSTGCSLCVSFYLHLMQRVCCLGAHRKHFLNSLLKGFNGIFIGNKSYVNECCKCSQTSSSGFRTRELCDIGRGADIGISLNICTVIRKHTDTLISGYFTHTAMKWTPAHVYFV